MGCKPFDVRVVMITDAKATGHGYSQKQNQNTYAAEKLKREDFMKQVFGSVSSDYSLG